VSMTLHDENEQKNTSGLTNIWPFASFRLQFILSSPSQHRPFTRAAACPGSFRSWTCSSQPGRCLSSTLTSTCATKPLLPEYIEETGLS
jgi:hypothetical protein